MRVLILGSMPGEMSLRMGRYYAHKQNTFWKIMGELIGAGPEVDYSVRLARLQASKIGLWDVLMSCERSGSLDSAIKPASMRPNDFATLFAAHPALTHVFFNGATAEHTYRRFVLPALPATYAHLQYRRLPSTSPAHAALTFEEKLQRWREILL
jgi:double-stranded uracil-DNA glycosylase